MSKPLVQLTNVGKSYHKLDALQSVSMKLNTGEVMGLFGHNGAGKTTMMKLILGVISPSRGEVEVMGMTPDSTKAWHCRSKIGYLPENVSFYEQLTGIEVLTYFAKLKGYVGDKATKHATALLEQVGITHAMKRKVKTYSKGMRQRLGLAQAFIGEPRLLLLDEPTVGLDPIITHEFYQTLEQLKNNGSSIILCSHVLSGVEKHIDRAMILSSGQLLAMGSLADLRSQATLPIEITPYGLNDVLTKDPMLSHYVSTNTPGKLFVPEQKKLAVLKQIMTYDSLIDLDINTANLEQVYQHFLTLNKSTSINPVSTSSLQSQAGDIS